LRRSGAETPGLPDERVRAIDPRGFTSAAPGAPGNVERGPVADQWQHGNVQPGGRADATRAARPDTGQGPGTGWGPGTGSASGTPTEVGGAQSSPAEPAAPSAGEVTAPRAAEPAVPFAAEAGLAPVTGAPAAPVPATEEPETHGLGWLLSMSGLGATTPVPEAEPVEPVESVVPEARPLGWFAPVEGEDSNEDAPAGDAPTGEAPAGDAPTGEAPAGAEDTDVTLAETSPVRGEPQDVPVANESTSPPDVPELVAPTSFQDAPATSEPADPRDLAVQGEDTSPQDVRADTESAVPQGVPASTAVETPQNAPATGELPASHEVPATAEIVPAPELSAGDETAWSRDVPVPGGSGADEGGASATTSPVEDARASDGSVSLEGDAVASDDGIAAPDRYTSAEDITAVLSAGSGTAGNDDSATGLAAGEGVPAEAEAAPAEAAPATAEAATAEAAPATAEAAPATAEAATATAEAATAEDSGAWPDRVESNESGAGEDDSAGSEDGDAEDTQTRLEPAAAPAEAAEPVLEDSVPSSDAGEPDVTHHDVTGGQDDLSGPVRGSDDGPPDTAAAGAEGVAGSSPVEDEDEDTVLVSRVLSPEPETGVAEDVDPAGEPGASTLPHGDPGGLREVADPASETFDEPTLVVSRRTDAEDVTLSPETTDEPTMVVVAGSDEETLVTRVEPVDGIDEAGEKPDVVLAGPEVAEEDTAREGAASDVPQKKDLEAGAAAETEGEPASRRGLPEAKAEPVRQRRDQPAPADRRRADPEQILASYPWTYDPQTLREQVDEPDRLWDVADRLTDRLEFAERDNVRAGLLSLRAVVHRILGELDDALADGREGLRHAEAAGDLRTTAIAQARLAHVLQWRGEFAEADRIYAEIDSPELPSRMRAEIRELAGRSAFEQGRYLEAVNHFERALDVRRGEDPDLVERIELALDAVARRTGDGWGPYPRSRDEVLGLPDAPVPLLDDGAGLWGYAAAVEPRYAEALPFAEGGAWVRKPDSAAWELIDPHGELLIPAAHGYVGVSRFSEGVAWVARDDGGWFAIDRENRMVGAAGGFEEARPFRRGLALVRQGGVWGAVDRHGRIVVAPRFQGFATVLHVGGPVDGFTDDGLVVVDAGERFGVLDRAGRVVIEPVHAAVVIHPGAFLVRNAAGLWGALSRTGAPMIDMGHRDVASLVDALPEEPRPVL
jgi:tetratricopeptide (TPR) repeat protein